MVQYRWVHRVPLFVHYLLVAFRPARYLDFRLVQRRWSRRRRRPRPMAASHHVTMAVSNRYPARVKRWHHTRQQVLARLVLQVWTRWWWPTSMYRHFINTQSRPTETRTPRVSHLHRPSARNSDRLDQVDSETKQFDADLDTLQSNVPVKWQSKQCAHAKELVDKPIATVAPGFGNIVTGINQPPQNRNKSKKIIPCFITFMFSLNWTTHLRRPWLGDSINLNVAKWRYEFDSLFISPLNATAAKPTIATLASIPPLLGSLVW